MRSDSIGLFWQDMPAGKMGRDRVVRPMPPLPDNVTWTTPKTFPNLRAAKALSFDTETYDPHLLELGPGWARGDGHIVGLSVSTEDGHSWYFPMRHTVMPEQNLDPADVLSWARCELGRPEQPKLGANLTYDVGWLQHEGVEVAGELWDVQFAEALLDETAHVSLGTLGDKYVGQGKDTSVLYDWLSLFYGGPATGKQRANLYRCPPCLVGPYAETDARLPFPILAKQWPELERLGLMGLMRLECNLIRLMIEMRFAGVPVDVGAAEKARDAFVLREAELNAQLKRMVGFEVNVNAADSLAKAFTKLGLRFDRTKPTKSKPEGAPSFTKEFIGTVKHPIGALVRDLKTTGKTRGTFLEGYILSANVDGYVFPQFHQLRGDTNGTRSGRFASSDPNYQNLPSRDDYIGPLVRGCMVPDAKLGHTRWRRYDYSQIEYRFFAHFAVGPQSEELRATYRDNPDTDYHEFVRQLIHRTVNILLERKPTKNINFGLLYGMGLKHLAEVLGLTVGKAEELFQAYHKGAPFVAATMKAVSKEAADTGTITTILGRRSVFDRWAPKRFDEDAVALPFDLAVRQYGTDIRRAYTHKALNRRLQGSAADLMKVAMLKCWSDGLFRVTGVPRLTVHDELDFSDPGTPETDEAFGEVLRTLETCMALRVPVRCDCTAGPNWGACK